jgi:gamma-F420-2:alpha-L-glutamate ligase
MAKKKVDKIARGWILYRETAGFVKQETYEVERLMETGPKWGYELQVVDPHDVELLATGGEFLGLFLDGERVPLPDFVIPRIGSGTTYFAMAVLRQLEGLGVYCLNGAEAVDAARDKLKHLQLLSAANVPIPKTLLVKFPVDVDFVEREMGFPIVVKTIVGTQGSGVHLCKDRDAMVDLVEFVEANNPKAQLVLQEFLEESKGIDLRLVVIGGRVVAGMQRTAAKGFKANVSQGGSAEEIDASPALRWLATEVARILDLDMTGIDFLRCNKYGYRICEVNSAPGFEGMERYCNIDVADQVFQFLNVIFRVPAERVAAILAKAGKSMPRTRAVTAGQSGNEASGSAAKKKATAPGRTRASSKKKDSSKK